MNTYSVKGSTLKIIAVVTMMIDHVGACVLQPMLNNKGVLATAVLGIEAILSLEGNNKILAILWWIMRMIIGRIAFPIYCFLLVEGFVHTRNVAKYAIRLFVFAIISEIPFDLAFYQQTINSMHQNVFFTLLIGLLTMWGMSYVYSKFNHGIIAQIIVALIGMSSAEMLKTDYGASGVALILLLYLYRYKRNIQMIIGCVAGALILNELAAPLSFIFISGYKGEKGLKLKYLFYIIYPLHLVLLHVAWVLMGR